MNKQNKPAYHKLKHPNGHKPTTKEFTSMNDDDINYSDIPESTDEQLKQSIGVPGSEKLPVAEKFLLKRRDLEKRHPCTKPNDINYRYLRPDDKFWEEATLNNIDTAINHLVTRRRAEIKSNSTRSHKKSAPRVSA